MTDYSKSYMFFNCDEWKSTSSMNPLYNSTVYRRRQGRRTLWKKIKTELDAKAIEIPQRDLSFVRKEILEGDAEKASDYITFGIIICVDEV